MKKNGTNLKSFLTAAKREGTSNIEETRPGLYASSGQLMSESLINQSIFIPKLSTDVSDGCSFFYAFLNWINGNKVRRVTTDPGCCSDSIGCVFSKEMQCGI